MGGETLEGGGGQLYRQRQCREDKTSLFSPVCKNLPPVHDLNECHFNAQYIPVDVKEAALNVSYFRILKIGT